MKTTDLLLKEDQGYYRSDLASWDTLTMPQKVGELLGSIEGKESLTVYFNTYKKDNDISTIIQHNDVPIDKDDFERLIQLPTTSKDKYLQTKKGISDKGGGGKFTLSSLSSPHDNFPKTNDTYDEIISEDNIHNHSFMGFKVLDNEVVNLLNKEKNKFKKDDIALIFYPRTHDGIITREIRHMNDFKNYKKIFNKYLKPECNLFWNICRDCTEEDVKHNMNIMLHKTKNIIFNNKTQDEKPELIGPSIKAPYIKGHAKIYVGPSGSKGSYLCLRFSCAEHLPKGWGGKERPFTYELNKDYWIRLKKPPHDKKPKSNLTGGPSEKLSWHYLLLKQKLTDAVPKPNNLENYKLIIDQEFEMQNISTHEKGNGDGREKDPRTLSDFYNKKFLRRPHIFLEINGCIVNYSPEPWTNLTLPPHLYLINEEGGGQVKPIVNMSENRNGTNKLKNGKYDYLNHQNILIILKENPVNGSKKSAFQKQLIKAKSGLWGCVNRQLGYRTRNTRAGSTYKGELVEYSWQQEILNFTMMELYREHLFYKRLNKKTTKNIVDKLKQFKLKNEETHKKRAQKLRTLQNLKKISKAFFEKFPLLETIDYKTLEAEAERLVEERKTNLKKNKSALEIQRYLKGWYCRQLIKKAKENERIDNIVNQKTKALKLQITELKNDKQTLTAEVEDLRSENVVQNEIIRDLQNEEPEYDDDEILFKREPTEKTKYNLWVRDFSFTDNEGNTHIPAYGKCLICQSVISVGPLFKRRRNGCLSLSGGHVIPHTPRTRHNEPLHKRGFQVLNNFIPLCVNCNSSMSNYDARVYMRRLIKDAESTGIPPSFDKDKVNEIYGPFWKNLHEDYKNIHGEEYYLKNHLI